MPIKCHICQLLHVHIGDNYVSIYISYELTAINKFTRNTGIHTFHIIEICPWTNMPTTMHIHVPQHFYCSLHIDPILLHKSIRKQYTAPLIYHNTPKKCQQQLCPSNTKSMSNAQIIKYVPIGEVFKYMCHIWRCFHQWCNQNHCTQVTKMMTMVQDNDDATAHLHVLTCLLGHFSQTYGRSLILVHCDILLTALTSSFSGLWPSGVNIVPKMIACLVLKCSFSLQFQIMFPGYLKIL